MSKLVGTYLLACAAVVGCEGDGCGGGGFPDAREVDAAPAGGTLSLAWTLTDTGGAPITCDQVGATTVTLLLRNRAVSGGQAEVLGCNSATGATPVLRPGTYDVRFELAGPGGLLSTATPQNGLVVRTGQDTALAPVTFAVVATGGLDLFVTANQAAGNCAPIANGGAGITATSIALNDSTGACEPITLTVGAGAGRPASTYVVDCANPVLAPCIENDQRLTAAGLPSGNYAIHVRGRVGATECYLNDDSLIVPALDRVLVRTLNLGKSTTPGC